MRQITNTHFRWNVLCDCKLFYVSVNYILPDGGYVRFDSSWDISMCYWLNDFLLNVLLTISVFKWQVSCRSVLLLSAVRSCYQCAAAIRAPLLSVRRCYPCAAADRAPLLTVRRCYPCAAADRAPLLSARRWWPCAAAIRAPLLSVRHVHYGLACVMGDCVRWEGMGTWNEYHWFGAWWAWQGACGLDLDIAVASAVAANFSPSLLLLLLSPLPLQYPLSLSLPLLLSSSLLLSLSLP